MKLFSVIALMTTFIIAPNQSAWKLKRNKNGIKVYTRSVKGSSFKEFKAVGELDADVATVVNVFNDFDNIKNWTPKAKFVKRLKKINSTSDIRHAEIVAPWPVKNRDAVNLFKFKYNESNKSVRINVTTKHDYIPKKRGVVRIKNGKGHYSITSIGKNKVKFVYQFHSEPGGNIPAWLANNSVVEIPYNTLLNLQKEVKKAKYKGKTPVFMQ